MSISRNDDSVMQFPAALAAERASIIETLWRRRFVVAAIVIVGTIVALFVALAVKPKYMATSTILMVAEPPGDQNKQVPTSATKPVLSLDLPAIALSETVLSRFRKDLNSTMPFDTLRSRIKAQVSTDSNIMPVTYTADSDVAAMSGANFLASEVTRYYRDIATSRFDSLIGDLQGQEKAQVGRLASLDRQLQNAAQVYPFIDINEGGVSNDASSVYKRLIDLSAEHDAAAAILAEDGSNAKIIARRIAETRPLAINNVVNNDIIYRNVRTELATNVGKLSHLHAFASDAYPGMAELRDAVSRERTDVAAARNEAAIAGPQTDPTYVAALAEKTHADAILAGDNAKLSAIAGQISEVRSKIVGAGIASQVSSLRRDRANAETALQLLASRLSQARNDRAEAGSTGSVVVIDNARFAQRAAWSTGTFVAVAVLVLSLWLAIGVAMVLESIDRRFDTEENVRSVYGLPVIGAMS